MSFAQGLSGVAKVVTEQPVSNNSIGPTGLEGVHTAGGWIPAIERAILRLSQNPNDNAQVPVDASSVTIQPTAPPPYSAPPPYTALYPDSSEPYTTFDSNISRSFQTNAWRDLVVNGHQLFKDLNESDLKMLEGAVDTADSSIHAVKITLDVAEDQKCSTFNEFLQMFAFVKNYLKFKDEKRMKSVLPESEIRQTSRYEPAVMSQVDAVPPQSRHPDPLGDPFCCWLWWMHAPPTQGDACPCCLCCINCCDSGGGSETTTSGDTDCCHDCDCGDCDCGDCDCGDCDCDCGGCDCGF